MSKTLANELAADKIRVNHLLPGRIDTDRVRELDVDSRQGQRREPPSEAKAALREDDPARPLRRSRRICQRRGLSVFRRRALHYRRLAAGGWRHDPDRLLKWQTRFERFMQRPMKVYLVNPSDVSFGVAVITPRWLFVLAAATPARYGDPVIVDETLETFDPATIRPGDVVGVGIHTGNALRGYEIGRLGARGRRHGRLRRHPRHAVSRRSARARCRARRRPRRRRRRLGAACSTTAWRAASQPQYEGGRVAGDQLRAGALGSAEARAATCGPRCRPCAAARSTARSARCGAPTARRRACARSTRCSPRSSSCAARASASSRSPTTTSIRWR